MDFDQSTQRRVWFVKPEEGAWRSSEEQMIVARCIALIHKVLPKCGLGNPRRAFITAAHYFHRYCVVESIELEEKPEVIALACLFIAGKTEEIPWPRFTHGSLQNRGFRARHVCEAEPSLNLDELLDAERKMLHALDFCLVIHQHRPLAEVGSAEELKETVSFMTSRACLWQSPSELCAYIQSFDLSGMEQFVSLVHS